MEKDEIIYQLNKNIEEMKQKQDEMLCKADKIIKDNKITHSKLEETSDQLEYVNDELLNLNCKVSKIKSNIVPSDEYEIVMVFQVSNSEVNIHRGHHKERTNFIKLNEGYDIVYEKTNSNGCELFKTFKLKYGRTKSKVIKTTKFIHKNQRCELVNGILINQFIELLDKHLTDRIDDKFVIY